MSEHETKLRDLLDLMRAQYPHHGHEAVLALNELLAEQKVTGLDDAMKFFKEKQKALDQRRATAKRLSNAEIADLKTEAGRCGWAAAQLREEKGRRKKGKETTG